MNHNPWLTFRRWLLRVLVLLIVLAVCAAFMASGESLLGALAGVVLVFLVAANVIPWIINDDKAAPPALPPNVIPGGFGSLTAPGTPSTNPSAQPGPAQDPGAEPADTDQAA
ncbi:hypothetical protein ACQP2Y_46925 (plasmid) [Actinoplanes sp. CA-051413]|uniref:hypothetical protein n=1 Tax=Actinoplanes sp. CA-051413 TaxID=3239899 RepID=UPI003D961FB5